MMDFSEHPLGRKDLEKLPEIAVRRFVDRKFKIIEENDYSNLLSSRVLIPVSGYDLFEIKIRVQKMRFRALGFVVRTKFWLLHVFQKKSKKIKIRNITTAIARMRQILGAERERRVQKQL